MKLKLIEEWRKFYKMWSVRVLFIIGIMPDIYTALVAMGVFDGEGIPPAFNVTIKVLATIGVFSRIIKQNLPPPTNPPGPPPGG